MKNISNIKLATGLALLGCAAFSSALLPKCVGYYHDTHMGTVYECVNGYEWSAIGCDMWCCPGLHNIAKVDFSTCKGYPNEWAAVMNGNVPVYCPPGEPPPGTPYWTYSIVCP